MLSFFEATFFSPSIFSFLAVGVIAFLPQHGNLLQKEARCQKAKIKLAFERDESFIRNVARFTRAHRETKTWICYYSALLSLLRLGLLAPVTHSPTDKPPLFYLFRLEFISS